MSKALSQSFVGAADDSSKGKPKRHRPSPLSIRITDEERAILERKAGKRSLGAYVRDAALGEEQAPRRKAAAKPSLDYALLGQILGKLGQSEQVACLFLLLAAAEADRITMAEEERTALHAACADMREVRALVMGALGLRGKKP